MKTLNATNFLKMILAISIAFLAIACDTNMTPPEELMVDTSISITSLSASESIVTKGTDVVVSYSTLDENTKIDHCTFGSGDDSTVTCTGSTTVSPQKTTVYTFKIISEGEVVREKSIQITVLAPDGTEIVDDSEPEICDDNADNDFNGVTDCDDEACAEDKACGGGDEEEEIEPTFTATYSPNPATVGEEVTVTWETDYPQVTIAGLTNTYFLQGDNTYTFTVEQETTTLTFYGLDENGNPQKSYPVVIETAVIEQEEHDTSLDYISFTASPSTNLFYGQPYSISWEVQNYDDVSMDEYETDEGTVNYIAGVDTSNGHTHTLTYYDEFDELYNRFKPFSVASFVSTSQLINQTVKQIVPGEADGEYYLVASGSVYVTTDYFAAAGTLVATLTDFEGVIDAANGLGNLSSFTVKDGNYYLGTTQGIFMNEGGTLKEIISTEGFYTVQTLATTSSRVLFGLENGIYQIVPHDDAEVDDKPDGYASDPLNSLGSVSVLKIIVNPKDKSELIAITGNDVQYSSDEGDSFTSLSMASADIKDGFWNENGDCLVWSSRSVYELVDDEFEYLYYLDRDESQSDINFAAKQGMRYFVATDDGVVTINTTEDALPYETNLRDSAGISFLIPGLSTMSSKETHAIKSTGLMYKVEWNGINRARAIGPFNFGIGN